MVWKKLIYGLKVKLKKMLSNYFLFFLKNILEFKNFFLASLVLFLAYCFVYLSIDINWYRFEINKYYIWLFLIISGIFLFTLLSFVQKNNKSLLANFGELSFLIYIFISAFASIRSGVGLEWSLQTLLIFLILVFTFNNREILLNNVILNATALFLIFSITIFLSRDQLFSSSGDVYGLFTRVRLNEGIIISRNSGSARNILYLLIILFSSLVFLKRINSNKFIFIFLNIIFSFFLIYIIYKLQSRSALIGMILVIGIVSPLYLYFNYIDYIAVILKKIIIKKIIILLLLIFALFFFYTIYVLLFLRDIGSVNTFFLDFNYISTGRLEIWKNILHFTGFKYLGLGMQIDRQLVGHSASNLWIYVYASSGIIGLFFMFVHIAIVGFNLVKNFINIATMNSLVNKYLTIISISLYTFFLFRGLVESSFSIVGIDLILWCFVISSSSYISSCKIEESWKK